jgi:putative hemolysin
MIEIDYINEKYNIGIPYGDYETVGGYIIEKIGRIPAQGETLVIDNFKILIARAIPARIDLVRLTVIPENQQE